MRFVQFVVATLVISLFASPVSAQVQDASAGEAARWREVAQRLEPAALVAVRVKNGARMKGTVLGVETESFVFKPRTRIPVAARDVRFQDVVAIERAKDGMNPGAKVVIGAGAVVGSLLLITAIALAGYD